MAENEVSGGPRDQRTSSSLDAVLNLGRSIPWQAFALIGVVVYGALRVLYGIFYGSFDVRPEEVGFGYADTLAHSAIAVIPIFLLGYTIYFFITFLLFVLGVRPIIRQWSSLFKRINEVMKETGGPKRLLKWLLHRVTTIAIFVGGIVLATRLQGAPSWIVGIGSGILVAVMLDIGGAIPNPLSREGPSEKSPVSWREDISQLAKRVAVWALLFSLATLAVQQFRWAINDAAAAKTGRAVPPSGRLLGLLPPWSAQPAAMFWIATDKAPDTLSNPKGHCVMYLGRANDITVVYDLDSKQTLRIPSRAVLISMQGSGEQALSGCQRAPD
jgi:hypothetical protein